MKIHVVQEGDTIESIAMYYNIPVLRLLADNNLSPNSALNIGQSIMIIPPSKTYIVKPDDTLESIAQMNGISVKELLRNNPRLSDNPVIRADDELILRYERHRNIKVFGYTTSYISDQVLKKTLPFLTYLAIFNYRIDGLGGISEVSDSHILEMAKLYGVAPIMFLSAMTETGKGSYATTNAIIRNLEVQQTLIENVLVIMKSKGYQGLDLAFYSILEDDLPMYVDFVTKVTNRLNQEGFEVFVTLTPHTLGYDTGRAYEQTYYAEFGKAANYVILITYLWQTESIARVAQTNVNFLKDNIDYVVTQIPPEKIFVGITRIAYDWEQPYVEGETVGNSLTNEGAINLANQLGSVIEFDEASQTPYFYYYFAGVKHFVWFKDARSNLSILNLVDEYHLAGVAVWNIMYYYTTIWLTINSNYTIE